MQTTFQRLSPATLSRVADFLTYGGRPLAEFENRIARRALRLAGGDYADAAAVLYVAADR